MNTDRLLAIAEFLYGPEAKQRVFEPLAADLMRECASKPPLALRARWWLAIAGTFVRCLPHATVGNISRLFWIDIAGRALAFAALALALQVLFGMRAATPWPPSWVTTMPFIVVPVIWRLRLESIAAYQQRLLTIVFTGACMVAVLATVDQWPLWAAALITLAWLALGAWRLGDFHLRHYAPHAIPWWAVLYPVWVIIVSSWPLKIALGIGVFSSLWPGDNLIAYIVGVVISLSVRDRVQQQIHSR